MAMQRVSLTPNHELLQFAARSTEADNDNERMLDDRPVIQTALAGVEQAALPLPHLDRIQAAFGVHDVRQVRAAIGSGAGKSAASLGADAYAVDNRIAFRGPPDLRLAAHEAAHVVQQRSRIALAGGVGQVGDAYERQADAAAEAVVAGRSAQALLGSPQPVPGVQFEKGCSCGTCDSCGNDALSAQPVVQLGFGELRKAEGEAEVSAGHRSGTEAEIEEKFFRLAEIYPEYPFPKFSGPRDLDDFIVTHPGEIDTFGGPYAFNLWVMRNPSAMHVVPLSKRLNPTLTAERYTAYENQRLQLHLTWSYPNRSYQFWGGRLLGYKTLRYDWQGSSTSTTGPSFESDSMSEWRADVRLGNKGEYQIWCRIAIGGSSRVEDSMTVNLDRPLIVVGAPAEFAKENIEKAATQPDIEGNEPLFQKGADDKFYRKPGAVPFSLEQQILINNIKMGALKALKAQGKISEKDYNEVIEHFEKRNQGLSQVELPSSKLYLLSGVFVSDEYPDTVPIRAVMANNLPNRGEHIRVVLQDVTLDPKVPTKHEGEADKPNTIDRAAWVESERVAIREMGEHWRTNNDYPHGVVTLFVGSAIDERVTITVTIPQQNWKKTLRTILTPIAIVGAIGALAFGQVEIAAPLMYISAGAGLVNIAMGIEHRIRMGTFGFDAALLLDVLQVVSTLMGVGAMSQAFRSFSYSGKVFYLVGMGTLDVTQGILIGVEAKREIAEAYAIYQGELAMATTDERRRELKLQYERKVGDIIGSAIVSGSFIVVSTVGGARAIKELPKPGGSPIEGPVWRPDEAENLVGSDHPSKPIVEPEPKLQTEVAKRAANERLPGELTEQLPKGAGELRITAEGHCKICHSPCEYEVDMARDVLHAVSGTKYEGYAENLATRINLLDEAMEAASRRGTLGTEYRTRFSGALKKLSAEISLAHRRFVGGEAAVKLSAAEEIEGFTGWREGLMDDPSRYQQTSRPERALEGTAYHERIQAQVVNNLPPETAFTESTIQAYLTRQGVDPSAIPKKSSGIDLYILDNSRNLIVPVDITNVAGGKTHVAKLHTDVGKLRVELERVGLHLSEPIEIEYVGQTFVEAAASIVAELRAYAHPPKRVK